MDAALKLWAVIFIVGALNYGSRLSFIAFFARRGVPAPLARALRYVPAAMLTALIVPMIVAPPPGGPALAAVPKIAAATIAGVTAWRTGSMLKTLASGMLALWLIGIVYGRIG